MKLFLFIFISFNCHSQSVVKVGRFEFSDVALHVDGTALISCGITQLTYNLTDRKAISILTGVLSALTISIVGKEIIHDKILERGIYSKNDIQSDVWGAAVSVPIMVCKFDFDENGFIKRRNEIRPRQSKFNKKKYILD